MSQILVSVMPLDYTLNESEGKLKLGGIFQRANAKNENGRVYPRHILEREVNSLQSLISERRLLSELNHPQNAEINLERVCQLITSLVMKGDEVMGEAEVLSGTPYGGILESLLKNNVKLGISSRGKGSTIYQNNANTVSEDYKMITFDVVAKPSTSGAFPSIVESADSEFKRITLSDLIEKVINKDMSEKELIGLLKWSKNKKTIIA